MSPRPAPPAGRKNDRPLSSGRRIGAAALLIAGVLGLIYILQLQAGSLAARARVRIHQPLPDFQVEAGGASVSLSRHIRGTRCVLALYSPSCGVCREMIPLLHPLPSGVRLVLINEFPNRKDTHALEFPEAMRLQDTHRVLARAFAAASLPIILLVDEHGILRDGLAGAHPRAFIQKKLQAFAVHRYQPVGTSREPKP